ncbi:AMMECR1 domain-containing protein, partial [Methanoculleus sp.]|uniref:AMMECR1 domain-containing protein n=1 Tax=Methanoculleus sp. TaxID=90427 RepID=UPI0026128343
KHGLIVSGLGTGGLLLPQVPTEYGWTSRVFLDQTCVKAGLRPGCWRRNDVAVQTFEGQIFEEKAV